MELKVCELDLKRFVGWYIPMAREWLLVPGESGIEVYAAYLALLEACMGCDAWQMALQLIFLFSAQGWADCPGEVRALTQQLALLPGVEWVIEEFREHEARTAEFN